MTILKRSFTEMQKYDCSLRLTANTAKALYQELKLDILNTADIQVQISMNKKQILDLHKKMFHYWQGKNGKWYTYLPKEGVEAPKGKQVESIDQNKLNNKILDYYMKEDAAKKQSYVCHCIFYVANHERP